MFKQKLKLFIINRILFEEFSGTLEETKQILDKASPN